VLLAVGVPAVGVRAGRVLADSAALDGRATVGGL